MIHPIPEIIENKIVPTKLLSKAEPMKNPMIPTRIIIMTETMVLSFFILIYLHKLEFIHALHPAVVQVLSVYGDVHAYHLSHNGYAHGNALPYVYALFRYGYV